MENQWLLTWLLAPLFSPAAIAVEAYGLYWYVQDARPVERRPSVSSPTGREHVNQAR
jgi:hypothetical protein